MNKIINYVNFVRELELLKNVTRTAWGSSGRQESTAEHSWRLALFAGVVLDEFSELDSTKVLMMALVHDLGELYGGDISAALYPDAQEKYGEERKAVETIFSLLEEPQRTNLTAIWQEYEDGLTKEARLVKALDKAETILQHNQGKNPSDFDYAFNLQYGKTYFKDQEFLQQLRAVLDTETKSRILEH